jgi:hypothetical protein
MTTVSKKGSVGTAVGSSEAKALIVPSLLVASGVATGASAVLRKTALLLVTMGWQWRSVGAVHQ